MAQQQWSRPIGPVDVNEVIALTEARWPGRPGVQIRGTFLDPLAREVHSVTVRSDGELIAYGQLSSRDGILPENRIFLVVVDVDHEGQGLAHRIATELLEHVDADARKLVCAVDGDDQRSRTIMAHYGFEEVQRGIALRLDLTDLPAPPEVVGVDFEWRPNLDPPDVDAVDAMLDVAETSPERDLGLFFDVATMRSFVTDDVKPVGWIARVDGRPVALGHGVVDGDDFDIFYVCVHPDHRRRGIGLALKEKMHASAAALGATGILTTNEAANTGIRALNARLGYVPAYVDVRMQRLVGS